MPLKSRSLQIQNSADAAPPRSSSHSGIPCIALLSAFCLLSLPPAENLWGDANSVTAAPAPGPAGPTVSLAQSLGVHFIPGSSSKVLIERDGKTYVVDLAGQTISVSDAPLKPSPATAAALQAAHSPAQNTPSGAGVFAEHCAACHGPSGKGIPAMKTPDFTSQAVQSTLSEADALRTIRDGKPGTAMPAWSGKLTDAQINAVAAYVKSLAQAPATTAAPEQAKIYTPADDFVFSLPTGRRLDRHGFYFNFTHRFPYTPAFTGPGSGNTLFGLDDFAIASFGLRYGVTDKLSAWAYRSPSEILRPIELGVAYNFLDERDGQPLNAAVRASLDGQNNFQKNFTTNLELILSRSIKDRGQLYFVPTLSIQDRELISKPGSIASVPPNLPGVNTFSLGIGGALRIRPTAALVAEVIPTLANGAELGIHRPAYAFGIQKRLWRHAFTFGFTNSPGTTVSQRSGTRATFLGEPSADTPGGLFIGFNLMRQIY